MKLRILLVCFLLPSGILCSKSVNTKTLELFKEDQVVLAKDGTDMQFLQTKTEDENENSPDVEATDTPKLQQALSNTDDIPSALLYMIKANFDPLLSLWPTRNTNRHKRSLDSSNTLLGATEVSPECLNDFNLTQDGLARSEIWAISMYDAMGKVPANLLGGNFKWLGNIDECNKVEAVVDGVQRFYGKYCKATLNLKLLPDVIRSLGGSRTEFAVCASNRCTNEDIRSLLQEAFAEMTSEISVGSVMCHGPRDLTSDAVIVICILSILAGLVVFGTVYDVVFVQLDLGTRSGYEVLENPQQDVPSEETHLNDKMNSSTTTEKWPPLENGYGSMKGDKLSVEEAYKKKETEPERSLLARILLSFSCYTNGCKILSTTQGSETLGAVNGIRFLSMSWVILGHSYSSLGSFAENRAEVLLTYYGRWSFCAIAYATVSVDSFFVLSAVLVAYLTLKELKRVGGVLKMNWAMFYFHRFWRLTPPYMLVLMIGTVLTVYFSSGAMGIAPDVETHPSMKWCRESWWTNLLYVNNYVNTEKRCMGHAWYLANDMQFYVISPLIVVPLFYNVIAGGISSLLFFVATVTCNAVIVSEHEYQVQSGPNVPKAKDNKYFDNIYAASYARMGPYIVGLLTGYLLYRLKCKCRIPWPVNTFLWLVCFTICGLCVYGPFSDGGERIFTQLESTMYFSLARTGWGLAVAWVIFACATGNGGWINQLLSWSAFIPLGRLSYCAYLIHPYIQRIYFENRANLVYVSNLDMIYMFLGHMGLTYGASYVVSLVFEAPMMGLEKALLRRKAKAKT